MTRKDYILLAGAMQTAVKNAVVSRTDYGHTEAQAEMKAHGVLLAAQVVADALANENPRFDKNHFMAVVRNEKPLNSRP